MSDLKLNEAQQYFLQVILNAGVIDQISFKRVFSQLLTKFGITCDQNNLKDYYAAFLREINFVIKNFNMEIRTGVCEITSVNFYCLVRQSDPMSIGKLSSLYSTTELTIFKKILAMIVESDEGYVEYTRIVAQVIEGYEQLLAQASSQAQSTKMPTNKEIRLAIEKFIQDNWLNEVINQPNMITLHGRAVIELSQYIAEIFDKELLCYCALCNSLVLSGVSCENCSCKIHRACAKNLFKSQKCCRKCRNEFPDSQIEFIKESLNEAKRAYENLAN
jgi:hypothetical protein